MSFLDRELKKREAAGNILLMEATRFVILNNFTVVLVDTIQPGNIGSAARAMTNLGLSRLKLVRSQNPVNDECRKMAGKALALVESAPRFDSFNEAVAGENILVATTSARGRSVSRTWTPRELAPRLWNYARSQRVALIFGPERGGLTDDQVARCQYLVQIPTVPESPTLNLAQAVLLVAYEVSLACPIPGGPFPELASQGDREEMFRHMEKVLTEIGFLSQGNPDHIMKAIRRFLNRAKLEDRDLRILRGIMSQMEWYVRRGYQLAPEKIRKP